MWNIVEFVPRAPRRRGTPLTVVIAAFVFAAESEMRFVLTWQLLTLALLSLTAL
jgi:hypothetical protein